MENRMTAQQLKNSILQMAIQGKLVEQDPNDESASVLLERIKKEKEQLIKEGKIKKNNNESYIFRGTDNLHYEQIGKKARCIDDEIPFEIPDSWEWTRLINIGEWRSGATPSKSKLEYYKNGTIPWLLTGDLNNGIIEDVPNKITSLALDETSVKLNPKGSILIAMYGATIGKLGILSFPATTNQACCACNVYRPFYNKYLFYFLMSNKNNFIKLGEGGAQPNISREKIIKTLIPVPPIQEQKRIVKKIEELEPLIDEYKKAEEQLYELNSNIKDRLKKSILQYAIEGKLVEQNPNDEPASVLLERIRNEKNKLIAEGKLKKDKNESVIFRRDNSYYEQIGKEVRCIDDEIPFDIPDNWELTRLSNICYLKKGPFGSALTKSIFVPKSKNTVKVYEQKNAIQKNHTLGNYYIDQEYYQKKMSSFTVKYGDIIVSCAGTIGETYVMPKNIEVGIINQALMIMRLNKTIDINYFLLYFNTNIKNTSINYSKGSAIKNIPPLKILNKLIVPIPPSQEQKRMIKILSNILNIVE